MKFNRIFYFLLVFFCLWTIAPASDTPEYVLGPGDEVFIEVYDQVGSEILLLYKENVTGYKPYDIGNPYAGNRYVLSYTGMIELPGLGKFKAKGKKIKSLEKEISEAAKIFDKNPKTIINLLSVKSINVYVVGAVNQPGLQNVKDDGANNNLINVIAKAGGYQPNSDHTQVMVENNGRKEFVSFTDNQRCDYVVKDNSYIYVPSKKDSIYVVGEIRWPGRHIFYPALSLSDYLGAMGGILTSAAEEIYVINSNEENSSQNAKVKIKDNLRITAVEGELQIKPGTIIYIPKNIFASWRDVFSNLVLIRDTINYPRTFNDSTTYYIESK